METSAITERMLALSALPGVGAKTLLSLTKVEGNLLDRPLADFRYYLPTIKNKEIGPEDLAKAEEFAKRNLDWASKLGHRIISVFDSDYPALLKCVPDAPALLFCAGDMKAFGPKSVSVIGTREPTFHGQIIAERITYWFAMRGWTIVSGLAKGIDAISHKACIDAGGTTAAILAHGLEKIYPSENKLLASEILEAGGALVSEYPYMSPTFKASFVQRDRIQAALASAVILVQTDTKGGSLHASKAALKYGRKLVVVGQSQADIESRAPKAQGNIRLIEAGGEAFFELFGDASLDDKLLIKLNNKNEYSLVEKKIMENPGFREDCESFAEKTGGITLI